MGVPDGEGAGTLETLDRLMHRLVGLVTGHEQTPAETGALTVEDAVRRIADRLPEDKEKPGG